MEYRKLSTLKKLPNNPRVVRGPRFADLCASLKKNPRFFDARPLILSNRTGELVILAGHQKYEAAKACKLAEVPTELIDGLTVEQEREIIIRDNAHAGDWDFDVLANEWSDLPLADWGVDLPDVAERGDDPIALREVGVSEVLDRFWMSVTGPLPKQREALEKLAQALESLPGVKVALGTTTENPIGVWL